MDNDNKKNSIQEYKMKDHFVWLLEDGRIIGFCYNSH